ncbi:MAG: ferritin-like domain-containing protein, partial [Pseudomonadota bacterium]|nr:ferritin-like domain-containing protein [Pseudomonadota bacterium]
MNDAARAVLEAPDPRVKAALARQAFADWSHGAFGVVCSVPSNWPDRPARPERPKLLPPRDMPTRKLGSEKGRAAQIHALAHIELNAIDLACDMAGRFCDRGLDDSFFGDWLSIAADEARHFLMLEKRLNDTGFTYGDFSAHDGLWEAAYDTRHDLAARLAIVPMVLEARGLD